MDTAQADQNIAEHTHFMGTWLDEETLRDEFDAIIAAAWPAEQITRIQGRIAHTCDQLMPRSPRPPCAADVDNRPSHQRRRGIDQHVRERSPPAVLT